MKNQRKNRPSKKKISPYGMRIDGGIYLGGRCIKICKDEKIDEFLQSLETLKLKYSGDYHNK